MKITDALIAEHGAFFITLDFMEGVLPKLNTVTEVQLLGALLERLLHSHGETEENLLLVMLDHTLEEKGTRDRMHQAHLEIDVRIKEIQSATQLAQARRLLKGAITTTRKHFKYEEQTVFPLAEKTMSTETLEKLGRTLLDLRRSCSKEEDQLK